MMKNLGEQWLDPWNSYRSYDDRLNTISLDCAGPTLKKKEIEPILCYFILKKVK